MTEKKNIEQLVKEGFEGTAFKAPDALWSSINSELVNSKDTSDQRIKESYDHIQVMAPLGIWEGIEKELTIDKGWRKTAVYLRRRTGVKWTKRVIAFAVFLFFITSEYPDLSGEAERTVSETSNPRYAELVIKNEQTILTSEKNLRLQLETLSNPPLYSMGNEMNEQSKPLTSAREAGHGEKRILSTQRSFEAMSINRTKTDEIVEVVLTASSGNHRVNSSDSLLIDFSTIGGLPIFPLSRISLRETEEITIIDYKPTKNKVFEAGLFVGVTTTEIINNTTRAALDPSSLISLNPSISSHLGVQGVYHFSKSHSLVGSLNRLKVGQSTNQYSNGEYQKKDINFEFIRFQTMYQLKFKRLEEQRNFYTLKVGPYIGLLSRKSATVSGLSSNSSSSTETLEYIGQVDAGLSFHVGRTTALKNFVLDYGLSFDKGWVNLNKGTGNTPSSFDRTTTIDLGAYISVRYKF